MKDLPESQAQEQAQVTEIEAAVFRRLLAHLDENKSVQNIDLMNLAGFCRNCLSKWYTAESNDRGISMDLEQARERVYGMPYAEWKARFQTEATPEQQAAFNAGPGAEQNKNAKH